ncbi:SbcC/MukB-like Walker B domain-containing protein [Paenibacillus sp. Marseille-Q4541]|uniref:AAA family ATPase n=1 Tax=Paenibacillus sp. Marseille-Q4541 TaxID=2831522 RepID=UPI001BA7458E|nr:SbcC/MukB-like Walker B domain-containing protein [Paenibacillus sp. Marseille-Q4541]
MRPVKLKLSGLQSYREVQEIDFRTLTETGLFGIFGPTGSGKSTILDAITLAMYGKVERAVNGTQGIMNQAEDSLFVSFTFELQSEKGTHTYRVERRFKRTGEVSVSNSVSRFIAVTEEGEQVLADKLAEVNRAVEDMIGLKMDDFTRAVVLPQGKFAEFLSLKGTERRQMLQRLFHLEKYGDQLAIKLSRKVKENDSALKAIEAEQQGLGLASEEALKEAELQLEQAMKEAQEVRALLEKVTIAAEGMAKMRELISEHNKFSQQLEMMAQQQDEIIRLEQQLERSTLASTFVPMLEEQSKAKEELSRRCLAAQSAEVQLTQREKTTQQCALIEQEKERILSDEEPKLLVRLEQLEQARELEKETDQLVVEVQKLVQQRETEENTYRNTHELLLKEQDLHARALIRRKDLQEQLSGCEVKSGERRELLDAISRKHRLDTAMDKLKEAQHSEQKTQAEVQQAARQHLTVEKEATELLVAQQQLGSELSSAVTELSRSEAYAGSEIVSMEQEEARLRAVLKEEELQRLSTRLAAELIEGKSCPVCGSVHHPNPQGHAHEPNSAREEDLEQLRALRTELAELRLGLRQQLHELRAELTQHSPAAGPQAAALSQAEAAPAKSMASAAAPGMTAEARVRAYAEGTRALGEAAAHLAASLAPLREEAAQLTTRAAEVRQRQMLAAANHDACVKQHAEAQARVTALLAEVEALRASWAEELPGISPEEATVKYESLQERDTLAEDLKERLQRSVTFLEEKASAITDFQQQLSVIDKRRTQLDTERSGKEELLQEKVNRLRAWVGEDRAEVLLKEATLKLTQIREEAKAAKLALKEAEEYKQEAEKQAVLAKQSLESAEEQHTSITSRYESERAKSPFDSDEEIRRAYMDPASVARTELTVTEYRNKEKEVKLRIKDLDEKLQGTVVTEEEWQHTSQRLRTLKAQDEEAMRIKARAERDLEDITRRHERWMELDGKRSELALYAEQLSKLQSVFRGNTFVEYIAEEQLMQVSRSASARLRYLTKQRYALEVDSGGGFVIVDDANGGVKRPVSTLSGGETFLTSLSLALALSAQIQLRGQYPLQFFFLDEGFGTLDPELLDTVITSLEKLHNDQLAVGVISHVPELRARLARKLVVIPAEDAGGGSKVMMEQL